ncbi:hypothetical protein BO70DRAFT_398993 [Aspergillus heteromorphus CBS 117.55]|uniref:Amino acid permease/ SLC12A domain-containing protein n=1 Tax=Aspergillus heteromorphus CBS 117.55 TaxID=1448321 RepID=A0A317VEW3_9EURO|nr:uncharacterized protein BO70DRAFT_398993 [Aspergillus heteromorphus CBS 117.55]PWY72913.1 hypothetical protein BO70DRAFT_398993 [Aspergillus heteromorphus CBS 117.55]
MASPIVIVLSVAWISMSTMYEGLNINGRTYGGGGVFWLQGPCLWDGIWNIKWLGWTKFLGCRTTAAALLQKDDLCG